MEFCSIRQATPGDIDSILRIEGESFDLAIQEDRKTFLERIEVFPEGFVLLHVGEIAAGYLCSELWDLARRPIPSDFNLGYSIKEHHRAQGSTLYISSYGILARLRGKGLGKILFRGFLDYARDILPYGEILLLVSGTWTGAQAIYSAEGFSHILTVPRFFHFSDGSQADGMVMRRLQNKGPRREFAKEQQ